MENRNRDSPMSHNMNQKGYKEINKYWEVFVGGVLTVIFTHTHVLQTSTAMWTCSHAAGLEVLVLSGTGDGV